MIVVRKWSLFLFEGFWLFEFLVYEICFVFGRILLKDFNVENRMFVLFEKYSYEYLIVFLIN